MAVLPLGKRGKLYALREDLKLEAIARLLWFHRWILLIATLAGGSASLFFFASQDRVYEAIVLLEINLREDRILGAKAESQKDKNANQENIENTIAFLSSNFLLDKLADRLDLRNDDEFFSSDHHGDQQPASLMIDQTGEALGANLADADLHIKATIVANLIDHLNIRQIGGSNVISIVATSTNSVKAARIANALAALHLEYRRETRTRENDNTINALKGRIEGLRGEVVGLEGQIIAYKIDHSIEGIDDDNPVANAISVQKAQLATQLALAKVSVAETAARHKQFSEQSSDALESGSTPTLLISPTLRELRAAETGLLRQHSKLAGEFGAKHPLMVNLIDELAIVRSRMANEVAKIKQNLSNDVSISLARAAELEAQLALLNSKASAQEQALVGLFDLKQRSETSRTLLEHLLERHQSLQQLQHLDIAAARIMSPAAIPTEHIYPKTGIFSFMAAFATLAIAALAVFFHERLVADFGFTTMDQLRDFDLVPLGVVPDLKRQEAKDSSVEDYVLLNPRSALGEALQRIRTKLLQFEADSGKLGQVLLVTSSLPLEGKTSTSVILARQAAASGGRTLLIDADLRRPRVHEALGVKNDTGLSEMLRGEFIEGDVVRQDPKTPLDFLAAGQNTMSPADLFRSRNMSSLMTKLRQYFEFIIIDSPPICAVADSLVISAHADVCIFVARWRETTRSTVLSCVTQLRDVHAPLAGIVLSRVDVDMQAKYGEVDFGQYYGHYHDGSSQVAQATARPAAIGV